MLWCSLALVDPFGHLILQGWRVVYVKTMHAANLDVLIRAIKQDVWLFVVRHSHIGAICPHGSANVVHINFADLSTCAEAMLY